MLFDIKNKFFNLIVNVVDESIYIHSYLQTKMQASADVLSTHSFWFSFCRKQNFVKIDLIGWFITSPLVTYLGKITYNIVIKFNGMSVKISKRKGAIRISLVAGTLTGYDKAK